MFKNKYISIIAIAQMVLTVIISVNTSEYILNKRLNRNSFPSIITNTKVQELYKQELSKMRKENNIKSIIVPLVFELYNSGIYAINYRSIGGKDNLSKLSDIKGGYIFSPKPALELTKCKDIFNDMLDKGMIGYTIKKESLNKMPSQCRQFFEFLYSLAPSTSTYIRAYSFKHKIHSNVTITTAFVGEEDVFNLYSESIPDMGNYLYRLNNGLDLYELAPLHLNPAYN